MTKQEIVKALRICGVTSTCKICPFRGKHVRCWRELYIYAADAIESLLEELEQAKRERDEWKLRSEAAERDINNISRLSLCVVCKHWQNGTCALAAYHDDPSWECDRDDNHFEWRGPCAENGVQEDANNV